MSVPFEVALEKTQGTSSRIRRRREPLLRAMIKAMIPNRVLVAVRLAGSSGMDGVPLSAVPSAAGVLKRLMTVYGYGRSVVEGVPVTASGTPLPWYTYPMIEYLDSLDLTDLRVFEYGSGNSTLWWAARAREVVSVEDNPEWHARMSERAPANARLLLETDHGRYVQAIRELGLFDIIVVDGAVRYQCGVEAVRSLHPGGAILLDNADCLPDTTTLFRDAGLFEVGMNGFTPLVSRASRTSLFLSQPCRLRPLAHQPAVGGVVENWDCDQNRSLREITGDRFEA